MQKAFFQYHLFNDSIDVFLEQDEGAECFISNFLAVNYVIINNLFRYPLFRLHLRLFIALDCTFPEG